MLGGSGSELFLCVAAQLMAALSPGHPEPISIPFCEAFLKGGGLQMEQGKAPPDSPPQSQLGSCSKEPVTQTSVMNPKGMRMSVKECVSVKLLQEN